MRGVLVYLCFSPNHYTHQSHHPSLRRAFIVESTQRPTGEKVPKMTTDDSRRKIKLKAMQDQVPQFTRVKDAAKQLDKAIGNMCVSRYMSGA